MKIWLNERAVQQLIDDALWQAKDHIKHGGTDNIAHFHRLNALLDGAAQLLGLCRQSEGETQFEACEALIERIEHGKKQIAGYLAEVERSG
jgi:hypothetical protein